MLKDTRGNLVGTDSRAAHGASQIALWRMMSFFDTPLADLDAAIAADPGWAFPHVMKAGFLLSLTEPAQVAAARQSHEAASRLLAQAPPSERAHHTAVGLLLEGHWQEACEVWDDLLLERPHDALALQWAQLWDFYRGDAHHLRIRPARVLPLWDEADPLYPYVLALHAFGLEECHLYPQAEEAGRRALSGGAKVPWAVHAVAHVMEMQGRFDDGAAWLRQHQEGWSEGNGFAAHLWWHLALFRLETLDLPGALRLADAHLSGDDLQITLNRVDAASLLWRLHLLGADVAARFRDLRSGWDLDEGSAGHYAFNDLHAVLSLIGAGEVGRAEAWIATVAYSALRGADARRTNHAMTREIGLPLMRAMVAYARRQFDVAADGLWKARSSAARFGGSHAQRDLIDQTLLSACAQGGSRTIGRALLNERLMAKPATPLSRHWAEQMRARLAAN